MTGLLPVAALRFREAIAGRMLWLFPLHFVLAIAAARAMPGPSPEARREAADATALLLAASLGLAGAAVLGAAPLPAERDRARGSLVLAAPPGPAARVLGTALGTGGALALLVGALGASALAAVEAGLGGAAPPPRAFLRAVSLEGGNEDPDHPGLRWLVDNSPRAVARFAEPLPEGALVRIECRVRVPPSGEMEGMKRATVHFLREGAEDEPVRVVASPQVPFRVRVPSGTTGIKVDRPRGELELGLDLGGVRAEAGTRPRAAARGLHALALFGGLAAAMAAALALSTVAGSGVAAAGALVLALLALFRSTFADAAELLSHAGAVAKAREAVEAGAAHAHGAASATPPALAPLFRGLAAVLPDGTRFDLGAVVARNEVPDAGDASRAALLGVGLAALFLGLAVLGARRRP